MRQPAGAVFLQLSCRGAVCLEDGEGVHGAETGTGLLYVFGEPTRYYRAPDEPGPYEAEWVGLAGAGMVEHWNLLRQLAGPVVDMAGDPALLAAFRFLRQRTVTGAPDAVETALAVQALVARLFLQVLGRDGGKRKPVDRALDRLLHWPLGDASLKTVAAEEGVTREHLSRLFKARVGEAPGAYLRRARVGRALDLLQSTALPLADVAAQCGYGSTHTLARDVRRVTGQGPRAYRARQAGASPP